MSTLNKLPDGSPSPIYVCTARNTGDSKCITTNITEWWNDGKQVETIEKSAENFFYQAFDKAPFKIIRIVEHDPLVHMEFKPPRDEEPEGRVIGKLITDSANILQALLEERGREDFDNYVEDGEIEHLITKLRNTVRDWEES